MHNIFYRVQYNQERFHISEMKPASGHMSDVYCIKGRHRANITVTGYDDSGKRGGIRVIGNCSQGHENVSTFVGKDAWSKAVSSGSVKIGKSGSCGTCPYATGGDDETSPLTNAAVTESSAPSFDGAARRRSRGSRKGSRGSRKASRGSRKGSRGSRKASRGSRKGSRGSRKASRGSRKGSRGTRKVSRK